MSQPEPDERSRRVGELLSRIALGERAALSTLYELTSSHLFGAILRIQPDRGQAEDVLQEVYLNVWRAAQSFDAQRGPSMGWLVSVARNRAIDSLRRNQTQPSTVSLSMTDASGESFDAMDLIPSNEPGPLERLTSASDGRALGSCMGELTREQQQCLAMAYYQGLSHAEVAEQLHQPLGTVKSWVRRALLALRDCLGRQGIVGT